MIRLLKYIILTLILVLNCSISLCQNNIDSIKISDSVLISIEAIKVANAKMIELKFEKEINSNLKEIIRNDSILIESLENNLYTVKENSKNEIKKIKKQRNNAIGIGSGTSLVLLLLLIIVL